MRGGSLLLAAEKVNARILHLAEAEVLAEREAINSLPHNAPARDQRQQRNQFKFSRLLPGSTAGIHTLMVGDDLLTNKEDIDKALAEHWESVFSAPDLPEDAPARRNDWISAAVRDGCPLPDHPHWSATLVDRAIHCAGNSAPGPDVIPYSAYRHSDMALIALKNAATYAVMDPTGAFIPEDFNHSRLICLPKKPTGTLADGTHFYSPEATRPLSIVNTDNRLIAAAVKINLHDTWEAWISTA